MGLATQIKQLYGQLIGGTAPSGAASASGDISQRIAWMIENVAAAGQRPTPMLPGRFTAPADVTIAANVTLTEQINYFKNLTIADTKVLTGLAGGTLLIVEETLTIAGATSQITGDGMGGIGGASVAGAVSNGGLGGGVVAPGLTLTRTNGFVSVGAISATNPPYHGIPMLQPPMGTGGAGGNATAGGGGVGSVGAAGGAWYAANAWPLGGTTASATGFLGGWSLFWRALELFITCNAASQGGPGGGGGGSGGSGNPAGGTVGIAGVAGGIGGQSSLVGLGGGGGSGVGGGGGGGGTSGGSSSASGSGGVGGGMLLILCKTLNNAGIISADGTTPATAAGTAGGGGGGGGGLVVVGYETLTALGTIRANGAAGGQAGGAGTGDGGAGGAGLATSFKIRSGV